MTMTPRSIPNCDMAWGMARTPAPMTGTGVSKAHALGGKGPTGVEEIDHAAGVRGLSIVHLAIPSPSANT